MPYLRAISPTEGTVQFVLRRGDNVLGRGSEAALVVPDDSLSRQHAVFRVGEEGVEVADLGSKNGTQVNGFRIAGTVPLEPGDRVRMGQIEFIFDSEASAPEPAQSLDPSAWSSDHTQPMATLVDLVQDGEQTSQLQLMLRVAEELARPMDLGELFHRVLELTSQILDASRLVLLQHAGTDLVPMAAFESGTRISASRIWSRSIVQMVLDRKLAIRFSDTQRDSRLAHASSIHTQDIRCAMGAPLIHAGEVLGVLYVDNLVQARAFADLDLELLAGVANQAALALHHAQLREEREQQAVFANTLLRYFAPATVQRLLKQPQIDLEPKELDVTVLFCDIVDFTRICSDLPPIRVHALLNTFFPRMVAAVHSQDGTIEKYIGDALMAVWGAPLPQAQAADRALAAAFAMRRALVEVNEALASAGLPAVEVYMGLHTGPVAFGNLGTEAYLQFATVGDTTNVAARVCDVAKAGQIVLTDATRTLLSTPCELHQLPNAAIKGKDGGLVLYEARSRE